MPASTNDRELMALALDEAARGVGLTSPNPPAGAVVVRGARKVIATGYHRKAGGAHAEVAAMAGCAQGQLRGATLYVTLEPCSSRGKTPPCTQAIIDAGIRRVVYATTDPNPAHAGRAERLLRKHGIEVTRGVLRQQADRLLRPWAHWMRTGKPWVIAKAGGSLDGRITRPPASRSGSPVQPRAVTPSSCGAAPTPSSSVPELCARTTPPLTVRGKAFAKGKAQPLRDCPCGEEIGSAVQGAALHRPAR